MKQDNSSGYAALRGGAGLVDRPALGRILLTGADRRSYLQGLLTNDIAALTPGTGCYAAMLTAQGRMMTDMRVLELGDAVLLDVPLHVTDARSAIISTVRLQRGRAGRGCDGDPAPRSGSTARGPRRAGHGGSARERPRPALFDSTRVRIRRADALSSSAATKPGVDGFDLIVEPAVADAV